VLEQAALEWFDELNYELPLLLTFRPAGYLNYQNIPITTGGTSEGALKRINPDLPGRLLTTSLHQFLCR
jgi:type I restriction enzyme R subunit